MRVAYLTDSDWLDEELTGFIALLDGLAAHGFSGLPVLPPQADEPETFNSSHTPTIWEPSTLPVYGPWLLAQLREKLETEKVVLLQACTFSLWPAALELSREMGIPAVLCVDSLSDAQRAGALKLKIQAAHVRVVATTSTIASALGKALGMSDEMPETIWPAAPEPGTRRQTPPEPGSLCLSVCGSGESNGEIATLLQAIGSLVGRYPMTQFFFDALGRDTRYLWKACSQAKLLHNVSMVPRRLGHHELLLKADCIVLPEPLGKSRGIMMAAMSAGVPIISRVDPALDILTNYPLFIPVKQASEEQWVGALEPRLAIPAADWARADEARAWAVARFPSHGPIQRFAGIYRELLAMPLAFQPPAEKQAN